MSNKDNNNEGVKDTQVKNTETKTEKSSSEQEKETKTPQLKNRFRGYMPVVVDIETTGLEPQKNALLEVAAVTTKIDENGKLVPNTSLSFHLNPFEGAVIDKKALEFNGIDPEHPFRFPIDEDKAIKDLFKQINIELKEHRCSRAILVAHNAWFDLHFLQAAQARCKIKNSPFHSFSSFDTATLAALAYKQTVLAKACKAAKIDFQPDEAHSALYDAQKTAELFCTIVNTWDNFKAQVISDDNDNNKNKDL